MGTSLERNLSAASDEESVAMTERFFYWAKAKFRAVFQRAAVERELADELQYHIEARIRRLSEEGLVPDEARNMALREFGGIEQRKEECRDARGLALFEDLWRDVTFAGRALMKNPIFGTVAILTIALAIGANTAVFTLVHGVLLQALPLPDAGRLVAIGESSASSNLTAAPYENFRDWRAAQHSFEEMAARMPAGGIISGSGEPERVFGRYVSAGFFQPCGWFRLAREKLSQSCDDRPRLRSDKYPELPLASARHEISGTGAGDCGVERSGTSLAHFAGGKECGHYHSDSVRPLRAEQLLDRRSTRA